MPKEHIIAFLLAFAAIPFGAALMAVPILFKVSEQTAALWFWGGIIAGLLLTGAALWVAFGSHRIMPLVGMVFSGGLFVACVYWYFSSPSTVGPLRVRPASIDAMLVWNDEDVLPRIEPGSNPLAVLLKNTGAEKVVDIQAAFKLGVSPKDIAQKVREAGLFPEVEGDDTELHVQVRKGKPTRGWAGALSGDTYVKIDEIAASDEATVAYPPEIKNGLALWLIVESARRAREWLDEDLERSKVEGDPNLPRSKTMELLKEGVHERKKRAIILPDITVSLDYKSVTDSHYHDTAVLRAVYKPLFSTSWVGHDGNEYLAAGRGQIGFENLNNPSLGLYSHMKRWGVVKADK